MINCKIFGYFVESKEKEKAESAVGMCAVEDLPITHIEESLECEFFSFDWEFFGAWEAGLSFMVWEIRRGN